MAEVPITVPASIRDEVVPSRKRVKLPPWLEIAKPRLIPLLLATTLGGMALSESWPLPLPRLACTLGGGALAAAAAGVLNCLWEEQLDGQMQRTSGRALPSGRLSGSQAFLIAVALACSAALLLVAAQGALGALTVTQLLRFDIVSAHLATALLLVALLSGTAQMLQPHVSAPRPPLAQPLCAGAGVVLYGQCIAGALMATQWASGRCLRLAEGCAWLSAHRALATPAAALALLSVLLVLALPSPAPARRLLTFAGVLVAAQVLLGVLTLRLYLSEPLVTVGHQLVAALLIATFSAAAVALRPAPSPALRHG